MADIEFGVKGKNETIASIGQIETAVKGLGISTVASTGAMAGGFKALTATMMANPIGLIVVGFTALTAAMVKCTQAAREDTLAQERLNAALGFTSSSLKKQSENLAERFKLTEGEIVNIQRLTANYFQNAQIIERMTPAIVNMSVATGQSADAIAEQLSSAIKSGRGLRQYGLDLKDCKTEQEKVEKTTKFINDRFGDQAKVVTDLRSPLSQIGTATLELAGNIGQLFLNLEKAPVFKETLLFLLTAIKGVNDVLKEANESGKISIDEQIAGLEKIIKFNEKMIEMSKGKKKEDYEKQLDIAQKMLAIAKEKKKAEDTPPPDPPDPDEEAKKLEELLKARKIANDKANKEIEKTKELTYSAIEAEIKARGDGIDTTLELIENARKKELDNAELTAEQKKLINDKYNAQALRANQDWNDQILKEAEETKNSLIKAEKERLDVFDAMRKIVGITDDEAGVDKGDSKEKKALKKKQKAEKDELKRLRDFNKDKLDVEKWYQDALTDLNKKHADQNTELSKNENEQKSKFVTDYKDRMVGTLFDILKATAETAEEKKNIARGEAIIAGAQGIMGVIKNKDGYMNILPPPAGIILGGIMMGAEIAAIGVMTGVQLAQIDKAQFAYGGQASGRIVTGGKEGQDSVNATLMPGEIVYNPRFPNPALAQQVANTVPGMSNNNGTNIGSINYSVNIQGNVDKTNIHDIEKAIEKGTIKALKKAQGKGQVYINKSGSLVIHG